MRQLLSYEPETGIFRWPRSTTTQQLWRNCLTALLTLGVILAGAALWAHLS